MASIAKVTSIIKRLHNPMSYPIQLCSLVGKLKVTNSLGLHRPISYFYITTYLVWKWLLAWSLLTAMWACFLQSVLKFVTWYDSRETLSLSFLGQ